MRVISVTGGKGGIGKTTISINLALAFARKKQKVLLFDADLGLANVDVMLGLKPSKTLHDYLSGGCGLEDICLTGPYGLNIIPASSGIQKMADLSSAETMDLIRSFSSMAREIDIMIVDQASGISSQVMDFTHASQDIVVVVCNEPASLMDSYAVIKILNLKYGRDRFGVIVNKAKGLQEGYDVFARFQKAVASFISTSIHYLGYIPLDDYIGMAAREGAAVIELFPHSDSAQAFHHLSHGISQWQQESAVGGGIQFFFERLIQDNTLAREQLCKA